MSNIFDSVDIDGLRLTHFQQLMSYLNARDDKGWHYGNKEQFEQRHADLKEWLQRIIDTASSEGVVIPKRAQ